MHRDRAFLAPLPLRGSVVCWCAWGMRVASLSPFFNFRLLPRNILAKSAPFLPASCPGGTGLESASPGLHSSGAMQASKAATTGADGRCPKASLAPTRPRHALGKPGRTSRLAPDTRSKSTTPLPPEVPSKHHTGCLEPTRKRGSRQSVGVARHVGVVACRAGDACFAYTAARAFSLRHSCISLIQALGSAIAWVQVRHVWVSLPGPTACATRHLYHGTQQARPRQEGPLNSVMSCSDAEQRGQCLIMARYSVAKVKSRVGS